jgi:predicted RNA methylase
LSNTQAPPAVARHATQKSSNQVTSPHLAASFLFTAAANDDIEGKAVLDLGCGCGMLSIAASFCGAEQVGTTSFCLTSISTDTSSVSTWTKMRSI